MISCNRCGTRLVNTIDMAAGQLLAARIICINCGAQFEIRPGLLQFEVAQPAQQRLGPSQYKGIRRGCR
ncbi:MAG: hypothetical protein WC340_17685 [Kiritimatiellia bacterium]